MNKIRLILPNNGVILDLQKGEHLYFLGGPIRGANDWQAKAIKMLSKKDPGCYIVCPCRYNDTHKLYRYHLPATKAKNSTDNVLEFPNQTMWERYYLAMAAHFGSIVFWIPCEDKNNPRKKEDGPYARDTYGELGRWSVRNALQMNPQSEYMSVNLVVGVKKKFPGLSVIQKNFDADHGKIFPIYPSLEETINQAIQLATQE